MKLEIKSNDQEAIRVLEKLVKKKQRGISILGVMNKDGTYKATFLFGKVLSMLTSGFEKYVLPQQKQFINEFMSEEGINPDKYEVIIE